MTIEVEEELCKKTREICASYNLTLEEVLEQFLIFASEPENFAELKRILDIK